MIVLRHYVELVALWIVLSILRSYYAIMYVQQTNLEVLQLGQVYSHVIVHIQHSTYTPLD